MNQEPEKTTPTGSSSGSWLRYYEFGEMRIRTIFLGILTLLATLAGGCATIPYSYGENPDTGLTLRLAPTESQIERGRPQKVVDGLGHYLLSLPSKLILWNWQVDNHKISPETEAVLSAYLAANNLGNVKVRLNQYAPGNEWRRLIKNREMPAFFRYTLGALSASLYTILPGRLFGGDNYDPFTNTINLYSDCRAIALHEAAHAKDFGGKRNRHWKGWYAFLRMLPLTPLYQEARATGDAIGYANREQLTTEEKEAYKTLYPAYMTYIGGEGLRWIPLDPLSSYGVQLALALPGHLVGRLKALAVEEAAVPPEPLTAPGPS